MAFVDPALPRIFSAIALAVALCALAASPQQVRAETSYPDKAVRIVLPFAAGGVADITARIVAEKLGDSWDSACMSRTRPAPAAYRRRER